MWYRLSGASPFHGESEADTFANIKLVRYDANALYHNVTKFSMKFIYQTLKRSPRLLTDYALALAILLHFYLYQKGMERVENGKRRERNMLNTLQK